MLFWVLCQPVSNLHICPVIYSCQFYFVIQAEHFGNIYTLPWSHETLSTFSLLSSEIEGRSNFSWWGLSYLLTSIVFVDQSLLLSCLTNSFLGSTFRTFLPSSFDEVNLNIVLLVVQSLMIKHLRCHMFKSHILAYENHGATKILKTYFGFLIIYPGVYLLIFGNCQWPKVIAFYPFQIKTYILWIFADIKICTETNSKSGWLMTYL